MGPTWTGREEKVGSADPAMDAGDPLAPDTYGDTTVMPPTASADFGTDADLGTPTLSDSPAEPASTEEEPAGQAAVKPARPRFRTPRNRSRRPDPTALPLMDPEEPEPEAAAGSADTDSESQSDSRSRGATGRPRSRAVKHSGPSRVSGVTGWKVATAVLTAVAVLAVGWGVYQTTKLNRTQSALRVSGATASAQIQSLDGRTAALEASNSQTASELATLQQQFSDFTGAVAAAQTAAKEEYAKVTQSLSVSPADFKTAVAQTAALSAAYLTAKATADAAPADQEAQLKSLEAKSILLANCTRIWAGAAQQIYTSDNPQDAMSTVGKDLAGVAAACKVAATQ